MLLQGEEDGAESGAGDGVALVERLVDGFNLLLRLGERRAVAQAGDEAGVGIAMRLFGEVDAEGHPELHLVGGQGGGGTELHGEIEAGRHDAEDEIVLVVKAHGFAGDVGVGVEGMAPQIVAEEQDVGVAGAIVPGRDPAAELRRNAEHGQKVGGDADAVEGIGCAAGAEVEEGIAIGSDVGEGGDAAFDVGKVAQGRAPAILRAAFGPAADDLDEAAGVAPGERGEDDVADGAEDGGADGESAGEHENDGEGESGGAAHGAQEVAQIGNRRVKEGETSGWGHHGCSTRRRIAAGHATATADMELSTVRGGR